MREVTFEMIWQVSGKQTIDLPDCINIDDEGAIREYLTQIWEDIPLPEGDYIPGSDSLDECTKFEVDGHVDSPQCYINTTEGLPAAINRNVKVEWVNLNEGIHGDYDPDDPNDINFLRFDVLVLHNGGWQEVTDASYCTQMCANAPLEVLKQAALYLAREYANILENNPKASVKKLGEGLSWISPEWFSKKSKEIVV